MVFLAFVLLRLFGKPKILNKATSNTKIKASAKENHENAIEGSTPGMPPMLIPSKPVIVWFGCLQSIAMRRRDRFSYLFMRCLFR